ncbi:MAG TPA: cupin domain-containing protein [Anaerolineales bacterium]
MPELTADRIIQLLGLEPLPEEGGLFRQTYRSGEQIPAAALPSRYGGPRRFATAIYYLLTDAPDSFSALHRLKTDEVYHFYLGDPVEMLLLHPDGGSERPILGQDLAAGQQVQLVVPAGSWQGSRLMPGGRCALMGTTTAPGYEQDDFELGERERLLSGYPEQAELIRGLTR